MAKQVIKNSPTDFDNLVQGSNKINQNFTELYDREINPEDYGAIGDGITDDSQAISGTITRIAETPPIKLARQDTSFYN